MSTFWQRFRDILIEQLEGQAVKLALKKILGSAAMGGFRAWLIKFIVVELFDLIAEPIIKFGFRRAGYLYNKVNGKIQVKRLQRARDESDEDAYNAAVRDILS